MDKKEKDIFIFDLDGTIIKNNKELDKSIAAKLKELGQKGNNIIFATARTFRGVKAVLPSILWDNTLILCNGAYTIYRGEEVLSTFVNKRECIEVVSCLENNRIQFYAELGKELYIPSYVANDCIKHLVNEVDGETIYSNFNYIQERVYKIAIVDKIGEKIFKQLSEIIPTSRMYKHSDGSVDIVNCVCSKWNAFQDLKIKKAYNRVIAFGNDENDIDMLKNADIGVAVCTTNKCLLSVADINVKSNEPEGILEIIDNIAMNN